MVCEAIEQIDMTARIVQSYPDEFETVKSANDVRIVCQEGRTACSIGIECLHMTGNSIGIIRAF